MFKEHVLKTDPIHFQAIRAGKKTFELRKNDRNIQPGDLLTLEEFDRSTGEYTGEMESVLVNGAHPVKELLEQYPEADTLFSIRLVNEQELTNVFEHLEDEMKLPEAEIAELLKANLALTEQINLSDKSYKRLNAELERSWKEADRLKLELFAIQEVVAACVELDDCCCQPDNPKSEKYTYTKYEKCGFCKLKKTFFTSQKQEDGSNAQVS